MVVVAVAVFLFGDEVIAAVVVVIKKIRTMAPDPMIVQIKPYFLSAYESRIAQGALDIS